MVVFVVGWLIVIGVAVALIHWPIAVAIERKHPRYDAIVALTLCSLLIWPLWIAAIVWAYSAPAARRTGKRSFW